MSVRKATYGDLDTILGMGEMMHSESDYATLNFEPAVFRRFLENLIPSPEGIAFVYENEANQVVGFMLAMIGSPYFTSDKVANEILLYVDPASRGGRGGYRLIKAYREEAIRLGAKHISLCNSTNIDSNRVSALYTHMGFRHVGHIHHITV
jgi:GNAT superfamily N-acetyltransferase